MKRKVVIFIALFALQLPASAGLKQELEIAKENLRSLSERQRAVKGDWLNLRKRFWRLCDSKRPLACTYIPSCQHQMEERLKEMRELELRIEKAKERLKAVHKQINLPINAHRKIRNKEHEHVKREAQEAAASVIALKEQLTKMSEQGTIKQTSQLPRQDQLKFLYGQQNKLLDAAAHFEFELRLLKATSEKANPGARSRFQSSIALIERLISERKGTLANVEKKIEKQLLEIKLEAATQKAQETAVTLRAIQEADAKELRVQKGKAAYIRRKYYTVDPWADFKEPKKLY